MWDHCASTVLVQCLLDAQFAHAEILRIDFNADAVPAPQTRGGVGSAGPHEWVEHRVPDEAEHADEPLGEIEGVWSRMLFRRRPGQARPNLLKPFLVPLGWDDTEHARCH